MSALAREAALVEGLAVAVPLRLMELAQLDPETRGRRIRVWATDAANDVAYRGDDLLFGSKKSGGAARVFNALAQGLAALAYCPGGVTFAGRHWCADRCACPAGVRRGCSPGDLADVQPAGAARRRVVDVELPAAVGGLES